MPLPSLPERSSGSSRDQRHRALPRAYLYRGQDNLTSYKVPDAEIFKQVFCRTCGSLMPERYVACVSLGVLDTDPGRATDDNIFVAYRAPWYEIMDGLVCYDEAPPGGYS